MDRADPTTTTALPDALPAPTGLPADAERFYSAGAGIEELLTPPAAPPQSALERLGPAPFRRKGFPLLGFLASIYEHVSTHVCSTDSSAQSKSS